MRPKIILSLVILLYLMACGPISCTPPTINVSCDEADLIAAINQANLGAGHNTLILDANCIYELIAEDNFITDEDLPGIVGGTGLPPVSTPITIEGNNATIQRQVGAPNFRIFFVTGTGDLTLNDLSILNGAALEGNGHGGGIYVNGSILTMNNAHVDNNAAEYFGGGIYTDEGTLTINNSYINFNQAMSGGGIHNNGGIVSIDGDSMINNNIANINGGGIISANGSNGELIILGGQVSNNQAGSSGGAISITGSVLTYLDLDGVLFEGNTTNGEGGAIAISGISLTIMDSTFTNNQASGGTGPMHGGAIVVRDGGHGTIGDSLFDGNYSGEFGGAISNQISGGTISIYETTIQNNSAEVSGGGIYSRGNLFISNSTITANTALTYMGGGVFNQNGGLIIQDSTISDNSSASQGGGVYVLQSTLTITGSTLQGNQASTGGGGLSTDYSTTTIGGDSLFDGNTAQTSGGGIFNGQDSLMTLEDSIVSNNQVLVAGVGHGGGGIYNSGSFGTMTISTTTISGNTSGKDGGGVKTNGEMWITQSTINNNTAAAEGGGIWGYSLTMINSTVSENHSDGLAGGVYAGSNSAIISSTIVHNTSSSSPSVGGLFSFSNNMIKNSIIAMNAPKDCWLQSPPNVVGNNLDSDGTCTGFTLTTDPLIGPLADNGGPTWTHALLTGSPAIDAAVFCAGTPGGPVMYPVIFDQRFASRPGGPECDIGAYEVSEDFVPPPALIPITPTRTTYSCVGILGVALIEGDTIRIQLDTPGLPEGIYPATVGTYDFTCKTNPEYPDRLFCDGPKGEGGTWTTLTIFDPLGLPFCEQTFSIPVKDMPEEPSNCSKYTTSATCTADPKCTWDSRSGPCEEK